MKIKKNLSLLFSLICCTLGNFLLANSAVAQEITTDGTTNTTVQSDEQGNFTIEQGDRAGNNLFHSFGEFSVPTNGSASFNNEANIANIFSRVTGGNISQINGLIQANGSANLFLINPAGIVFGDGAQLNLGGSFYGSSADSILFEDGEFSATDLDNPPLITINAPIGFGFRDNPGEIVNRSNADSVGLQVDAQKTLALIGGNISLAGGTLTALGGRIELGGLTTAGTVEINDDGSLTFPDGAARGDVSLSNDSAVNVAAAGGGFISVNAKNLEMAGGSVLVAGIAEGLGTPDAQAGDIKIDATKDILLKGEDGDGSNLTGIGNFISEGSEGNAGDIEITTGNLNLTNKSLIDAGTFGKGNAGNVTIKAADSIALDNSAIASEVNENAQGKGGDIKIDTRSFILTKSITSSLTNGIGNAGNIAINATEKIAINNSFINSQVYEGVGNGGDISINTGFLSLTNKADLNSSAGGQGDAGDIAIQAADSISLTNKSFITSNTFAQGNAGKITIQTANNIFLDKSEINSQVTNGVGNGNDIDITTGSLSLTNGAYLNSSADGKGDAGDITIQAADSISLTSQSYIVSNTAARGNGNAGKIIIQTADNIFLDNSYLNSQVSEGVGNGNDIDITTGSLSLTNKADLNASALGRGDAGNINIQADNLFFRNQGLISTQSISSQESNAFNIGEADNDKNGGNVNIDSNFVVAFPNQNNDIVANAQQGAGGNININAQAIFGLQEGKTIPNNSNNDIDASSEFGLSGTVFLNTSDVNPRDDAREQPLKIVEADEGVSQTCANNQSGGNVNNLVLNGKGGVPAAPSEPLSSESIMMHEETAVSPQSDDLNDYAISTNQGKIIPARGIIKTKDGRIILTATPTTANGSRLPNGSKNCGQL